MAYVALGTLQKFHRQEKLNKARKDDNLFGKTENMRNTHFKGNESLIGQIVSVKITAARGNSLVGKLTS